MLKNQRWFQRKMYDPLTSREQRPVKQSSSRWHLGLTIDASDDEVLAFLADWRAQEIREIAVLN